MDRLKTRSNWIDELTSNKHYYKSLTNAQRDLLLPTLRELPPRGSKERRDKDLMSRLRTDLFQRAQEQGVGLPDWKNVVLAHLGVKDSDSSQITYCQRSGGDILTYLTLEELFDKVVERVSGREDVAAMDGREFLEVLEEIKQDLSKVYYFNGGFIDSLPLELNPALPPAAAGDIVPVVSARASHRATDTINISHRPMATGLTNISQGPDITPISGTDIAAPNSDITDITRQVMMASITPGTPAPAPQMNVNIFSAGATMNTGNFLGEGATVVGQGGTFVGQGGTATNNDLGQVRNVIDGIRAAGSPRCSPSSSIDAVREVAKALRELKDELLEKHDILLQGQKNLNKTVQDSALKPQHSSTAGVNLSDAFEDAAADSPTRQELYHAADYVDFELQIKQSASLHSQYEDIKKEGFELPRSQIISWRNLEEECNNVVELIKKVGRTVVRTSPHCNLFCIEQDLDEKFVDEHQQCANDLYSALMPHLHYHFAFDVSVKFEDGKEVTFQIVASSVLEAGNTIASVLKILARSSKINFCIEGSDADNNVAFPLSPSRISRIVRKGGEDESVKPTFFLKRFNFFAKQLNVFQAANRFKVYFENCFVTLNGQDLTKVKEQKPEHLTAAEMKDGDSSWHSPDHSDETGSANLLASGSEHLSHGWGNTFSVCKGTWKCDSCWTLNEEHVKTCMACEAAPAPAPAAVGGSSDLDSNEGDPAPAAAGSSSDLDSNEGDPDTKLPAKPSVGIIPGVGFAFPVASDGPSSVGRAAEDDANLEEAAQVEMERAAKKARSPTTPSIHIEGDISGSCSFGGGTCMSGGGYNLGSGTTMDYRNMGVTPRKLDPGHESILAFPPQQTAGYVPPQQMAAYVPPRQQRGEGLTPLAAAAHVPPQQHGEGLIRTQVEQDAAFAHRLQYQDQQYAATPHGGGGGIANAESDQVPQDDADHKPSAVTTIPVHPSRSSASTPALSQEVPALAANQALAPALVANASRLSTPATLEGHTLSLSSRHSLSSGHDRMTRIGTDTMAMILHSWEAVAQTEKPVTKLDLSACPVTEEASDMIAQFLPTVSSTLTTVNFTNIMDNAQKQHDADTVGKICEPLWDAPLKEVYLDNNALHQLAPQLLPLFAGASKLEVVSLSHSGLSASSVGTLCLPLKQHGRTIRKLIISRFALSSEEDVADNAMKKLGKAIATMINLEQLVVACLSGSCTQEGCRAITAPLRDLALNGHVSKLAWLDLSSVTLGDGGDGPDQPVHDMAVVLKKARNLRRLYLADTGLEAMGFASLTRAWGVAAESGVQVQLEELDLSANCLGTDGAPILAAFLETQPLLRVLNVADNDFGDEGLTHLGPSLAKLLALTSLNIQGNELGSDSPMILEEHKIPSLKKLFIEENEDLFIGDEVPGVVSRVDQVRDVYPFLRKAMVHMQATESSKWEKQGTGAVTVVNSLVELRDQKTNKIMWKLELKPPMILDEPKGQQGEDRYNFLVKDGSTSFLFRTTTQSGFGPHLKARIGEALRMASQPPEAGPEQQAAEPTQRPVLVEASQPPVNIPPAALAQPAAAFHKQPPPAGPVADDEEKSKFFVAKLVGDGMKAPKRHTLFCKLVAGMETIAEVALAAKHLAAVADVGGEDLEQVVLQKSTLQDAKKTVQKKAEAIVPAKSDDHVLCPVLTSILWPHWLEHCVANHADPRSLTVPEGDTSVLGLLHSHVNAGELKKALGMSGDKATAVREFVKREFLN